MATPTNLPDRPLDPRESTAAPSPDASEQLPHVNHVLVGIVIALVVSGLLSSGRLVDMAARQPFGPDRDRWLDAAYRVDDVAGLLRTDRPGDALAGALDRDLPGAVGDAPDAGEEIVLGALADEADQDAASDPAADTASTPPSSSDAASSTGSNESDASDEPVDAVTTTTTMPTTTTTIVETTTTTQRQLRPISAEEPLLMWVGGDSLGEYVATNLLGGSADLAISDLMLDFHISTGLTRPDFFDWPAQLSNAMLEQPQPEAIVFMVGGNDNQAMITEDGRVEFQTDEWREEYRARVATMMDVTGYPSSHMIWIGLPVMQPSLWEPLPDDVNTILAEEAAARPWVTFVDIDALYRDEDGEYDQFIVGPDGERIRARAPDGVHITRQGSEWIADLVWAEIQRVWPTP